MPNEENQTAVMDGSNQEPAATAAQNNVAEEQPAQSEHQDPDWKELSRKHERREKDNYAAWQKTKAELDQSNAELASMRTEMARMKAMQAYPQVTDQVLALCSETDPDKIADWADRYAQLNPIAAPQPKEIPSPLAMASRGATLSTVAQGHPAGGRVDLQEQRDRKLQELNAQREARNARNK